MFEPGRCARVGGWTGTTRCPHSPALKHTHVRRRGPARLHATPAVKDVVVQAPARQQQQAGQEQQRKAARGPGDLSDPAKIGATGHATVSVPVSLGALQRTRRVRGSVRGRVAQPYDTVGHDPLTRRALSKAHCITALRQHCSADLAVAGPQGSLTARQQRSGRTLARPNSYAASEASLVRPPCAPHVSPLVSLLCSTIAVVPWSHLP